MISATPGQVREVLALKADLDRLTKARGPRSTLALSLAQWTVNDLVRDLVPASAAPQRSHQAPCTCGGCAALERYRAARAAAKAAGVCLPCLPEPTWTVRAPGKAACTCAPCAAGRARSAELEAEHDRNRMRAAAAGCQVVCPRNWR